MNFLLSGLSLTSAAILYLCREVLVGNSSLAAVLNDKSRVVIIVDYSRDYTVVNGVY